MNNPRDDFESELKALLTVDPSPDLQSRIRTRALAPPDRKRWLGFACGLTAMSAGIVLMTTFIQPIAPEEASSSQESAVRAITPPSPTPVEGAVPAQRPGRAARPRQPSITPVAVKATEKTTSPGTGIGKIELQPFPEFDLTSSLQPIPQAPLLSIARLEPINIEPLALTVRNLGGKE